MPKALQYIPHLASAILYSPMYNHPHAIIFLLVLLTCLFPSYYDSLLNQSYLGVSQK